MRAADRPSGRDSDGHTRFVVSLVAEALARNRAATIVFEVKQVKNIPAFEQGVGLFHVFISSDMDELTIEREKAALAICECDAKPRTT